MKPSVTVFAPPELKIAGILRAMGVVEETYNLKEFVGSIDIKENDLDIQINSIKVNHVKWLDSFGYELTIQGKELYYSGDANEIPEEILQKLYAGKYERFYQDTCIADFQDNPHLSLKRLSELVVEKNVRSKVYCMHLDNKFNEEDAIDLGFNVVSNIKLYSHVNEPLVSFDSYYEDNAEELKNTAKQSDITSAEAEQSSNS